MFKRWLLLVLADGGHAWRVFNSIPTSSHRPTSNNYSRWNPLRPVHFSLTMFTHACIGWKRFHQRLPRLTIRRSRLLPPGVVALDSCSPVVGVLAAVAEVTEDDRSSSSPALLCPYAP